MDLIFTEEALRAIARQAMEKKTGARGLRAIMVTRWNSIALFCFPIRRRFNGTNSPLNPSGDYWIDSERLRWIELKPWVRTGVAAAGRHVRDPRVGDSGRARDRGCCQRAVCADVRVRPLCRRRRRRRRIFVRQRRRLPAGGGGTGSGSSRSRLKERQNEENDEPKKKCLYFLFAGGFSCTFRCRLLHHARGGGEGTVGEERPTEKQQDVEQEELLSWTRSGANVMAFRCP